MNKVHLQSNKAESHEPMALCATRWGGTGKVSYNSRRSYSIMGSQIVRFKAFAATPTAKRCAHCMDNALGFRNWVRARNGQTPVTYFSEGLEA